MINSRTCATRHGMEHQYATGVALLNPEEEWHQYHLRCDIFPRPTYCP